MISSPKTTGWLMGPTVSFTVPLMEMLPEKTGRPSSMRSWVSRTIRVRHQAREALGLHRVAEDVAERSGFLVLPRRGQDDVPGLRVVDGHLQHEVVPGAHRTVVAGPQKDMLLSIGLILSSALLFVPVPRGWWRTRICEAARRRRASGRSILVLT